MDSAPAPAASDSTRSERHRADRTWFLQLILSLVLALVCCLFSCLFSLGPSIVPMSPNASTTKQGRGTANLIGPEGRRLAGTLSRSPEPAADRSADVPRLRRRSCGGRLPQRRDRRVPDGELPQPRTTRWLARRDRNPVAASFRRKRKTGRPDLSEPDRARFQRAASRGSAGAAAA